MRIVTRPDFDGVVCAVLLTEAENIDAPIKWVQPSEMQRGEIEVDPSDIIANLPFNENCALWFDHHYTNRIDKPFNGAFNIAPSAAGVVFAYYRNSFRYDYTKIVRAADRIDSADLSWEEVRHPDKFPYVLLSMSIRTHERKDSSYWDRLVRLFYRSDIQNVMNDIEVAERCRKIMAQNIEYENILLKYTEVRGQVSITDLRSFKKPPEGNRFLVYSLFPDTVVNIKIRYDEEDMQKTVVGAGHSIFNRNCKVNIGKMLTHFGGGGHAAVGSCTFHRKMEDIYIPQLIDILIKNEPNT